MPEHRTREREVAAAAAACQRMSRQQQGLMLGASEHRAQARQREGMLRHQMGQASRSRAENLFDYDKLAMSLGRTLDV